MQPPPLGFGVQDPAVPVLAALPPTRAQPRSVPSVVSSASSAAMSVSPQGPVEDRPIRHRGACGTVTTRSGSRLLLGTCSRCYPEPRSLRDEILARCWRRVVRDLSVRRCPVETQVRPSPPLDCASGRSCKKALLGLTRSLVRMHSNSDSRRSASPARDVSRIGPATDCESLRNVGPLWGEKPLVKDSLGTISLVGESAESNS